MALTEKLSTLVERQFPAFYKEEGPNFLAFVKAYYEYMEQSGKAEDVVRSLSDYKDIDKTIDSFIQYFRSELMPEIPNDALADKKLLAKRIKDLYTTKGTIESYKLLFRILYNEDVEISFPADQMLKVSDGDFKIDRYLTTHHDPKAYSLIGKTIKGTDSQAEALVEDVRRVVAKGRDIDQILVSNIKGIFSTTETIKIKGQDTGYTPIVEAGVKSISIVSQGGEYRPGDVIQMISSKSGDFGKVVINDVTDLGGQLAFELKDGGSGYQSQSDGTTIEYIGGDGDSPASFQVKSGDITDTFALSQNSNKFGSNTMFGASAPRIQYRDTSHGIMNNHANTVLGAPDFGFREAGEDLGNNDYRTNANAVIVLANTANPGVVVGDKLYGVTSQANAVVKAIRRVYNATSDDVVLAVDTYKNFQVNEKINKTSKVGVTVGTVKTNGFYANTIGYHVLKIANTDGSTVSVNDELVGAVSGAFGVIKKVNLVSSGDEYDSDGVGGNDRKILTLTVTANTTANVSSQFDAGPMKAFIQNEGIRKVGSGTNIANVVFDTANTLIENVHTKLSDSLVFVNGAIGTIARLSNRIGGSGFSANPNVVLKNRNVSSLGIGEAYLTIQSTVANWGTGNSQVTILDTNDRIEQTSSGSTANIMKVVNNFQHSNGVYETEVRVWQDQLQRDPGNRNWSNNATTALKIYNDASQSSLKGTGSGKIIKVQDEGILGDNAVVNGVVGANGTVKSARVLDSGFSYKQGELVTLASSGRLNAIQATGTLTLGHVANSEGYYASTRGQVSSSRGYIQDSNFYQEFSYEISAPIALTRYKDIALRLIHPGGQKFFGKFKTSTNAMSQSVTSSLIRTRKKGTGTVAITNNSNTVTGTSTAFTSQFANGDTIIIETGESVFYKAVINKVNSATSANLNVNWKLGNISTANVHYFTGTVT
ncbi:MAG: hypothetical protein CMO44_09235 [Verrucomicrobiales bacterium]|nr:hypothetical protein [Verrucomicrobiales bacterium]